MTRKEYWSLWVIFILTACFPSKVSTSVSLQEPSLHLLDEYEIPFDLKFQHTAVGGLSSIDYHMEDDIYFMLSDDRSAFNPSRFYKAGIRIINNKIEEVNFISTDTLRRYDGSLFPAFGSDPYQCPDLNLCGTCQQKSNLYGLMKASG